VDNTIRVVTALADKKCSGEQSPHLRVVMALEICNRGSGASGLSKVLPRDLRLLNVIAGSAFAAISS